MFSGNGYNTISPTLVLLAPPKFSLTICYSKYSFWALAFISRMPRTFVFLFIYTQFLKTWLIFSSFDLFLSFMTFSDVLESIFWSMKLVHYDTYFVCWSFWKTDFGLLGVMKWVLNPLCLPPFPNWLPRPLCPSCDIDLFCKLSLGMT